MTTKDVERALVVSLVLNSLALTLAILCFPILQADLDALTTLVHKDVDDFKDSTDSIWSDILALQLESRREKREDQNYLYKYQPSLRHKLKRIRLKMHRKPRDMHDREEGPPVFQSSAMNGTQKLKRKKDHPKWGKRVRVGSKGTLPRSNFHRVHAAPTIQENPGRQIFSDAELIGKLEKIEQIDQNQYVKPKRVQQCPLRPNPQCPQGKTGAPGADGSDGENGAPGTDGKPGVDGTHLYEEQDKGCILCPMGPRGPKGPRGPRGEEGIQGFEGRPGRLTQLPGPPGPRGHRGEPGEQGPRGLRGQQGVSVRKWITVPGEKGPPGGRGPRGPPGPKGFEGEPGIEGVKGRRGPVGLAGVQGPPGERGLEGSYGRGGFDEHYCECPKRSKGVRGRFRMPLEGSYATEASKDYPKDVFYERRL